MTKKKSVQYYVESYTDCYICGKVDDHPKWRLMEFICHECTALLDAYMKVHKSSNLTYREGLEKFKKNLQ